MCHLILYNLYSRECRRRSGSDHWNDSGSSLSRDWWCWRWLCRWLCLLILISQGKGLRFANRRPGHSVADIILFMLIITTTCFYSYHVMSAPFVEKMKNHNYKHIFLEYDMVKDFSEQGGNSHVGSSHS